MLASLGMYDGGPLAAANDALWEAIVRRAQELGAASLPPRLDRTRRVEELWSHPELVFAQICGYPYVAHHRQTLDLLGTPVYELPGCRSDGTHASVLVVSARAPAGDLEHLRGGRAAINDAESMTGRHLFGDAIADLDHPGEFFASVTVSGSHAASIAMVASGEADVASIDSVSYALIARARPELAAGTCIIHTTRSTPNLPFVTARSTDPKIAEALRTALAEVATSDETKDARRALGLTGVIQLSPADYEPSLAVAARADRVFERLASRAS